MKKLFTPQRVLVIIVLAVLFTFATKAFSTSTSMPMKSASQEVNFPASMCEGNVR